jgi:hypothetical protein
MNKNSLRYVMTDLMQWRYSNKYADAKNWYYYMEYEIWIPQMKINKRLPLRILDIGSDDTYSMKNYLMRNQYDIANYNPYDLKIDKPFTSMDMNEFYKNYNFVKMDIEGMEYEIFKKASVEELKNMFANKYVAIALHNATVSGDLYSEKIYENIKSALLDRIFFTQWNNEIEEIYTDIENNKEVVK